MASLKFLFFLGLVVLVGIGQNVDGAGECGKSSPDNEALKLAPCAEAAQDEKAAVSSSCCVQVKRIGQNPNCLCAVLLSDTAKASGVKPEIAITIPKRCNFANRPVGFKCGERCGSFDPDSSTNHIIKNQDNNLAKVWAAYYFVHSLDICFNDQAFNEPLKGTARDKDCSNWQQFVGLILDKE
ncbi:hypothetical protein Tsubulata_008008 [Turnera subulata]|uniref:Bifunctional inhibitor/plant lipid transfer protein/seed storage helical domain-containing protein n=1 Tax=Turnera subulata TaxID=218843 RepID=A0A9Q0J8L4_9ROSI|nr:hypothetical protein Tsubulata_008008 [Turnera subulata]